jgi:hypothetical protein
VTLIAMPKLITFEQYSEAAHKADASMKANNGHSFIHILKTRCQWCHRSPKARGRCSGWFQTFLEQLAWELTDVQGMPEPKVVPKK